VFQIESGPRCRCCRGCDPRCFYDLVIEVAIVRPGPIQGKMVHPYLRRRNGEEPVEYPSEDVKGVLGKTLGVPLFQEQAMSLAMVAAGFTADEADQLRRAMAAWKRKGNQIEKFGHKLITGMLAVGTTGGSPSVLRADQGFQRVRLPRVARRELRAAGVRVVLAEAASSRGVRSSIDQQPADGVLRPGPDL
jgi:error-prone DNA polymerase